MISDPLKDICAIIVHSEKSRKTYKDATRQDPQLQDLLVHVRKRWPSVRKHCTSKSYRHCNAGKASTIAKKVEKQTPT